MNLLDDEAWLERTSPPERPGYVWRRKRVAGQHLGAGLIELPPGESTFPYHHELGNDELLVVVLGTPTLRTPDGERKLAAGDCVLFPSGPERTQDHDPLEWARGHPPRVELRPPARHDPGRQREADAALGARARRAAAGRSSAPTPTTGTARPSDPRVGERARKPGGSQRRRGQAVQQTGWHRTPGARPQCAAPRVTRRLRPTGDAGCRRRPERH